MDTQSFLIGLLIGVSMLTALVVTARIRFTLRGRNGLQIFLLVGIPLFFFVTWAGALVLWPWDGGVYGGTGLIAALALLVVFLMGMALLPVPRGLVEGPQAERSPEAPRDPDDLEAERRERIRRRRMLSDGAALMVALTVYALFLAVGVGLAVSLA